MKIVTADHFANSPFSASIELMYRYQRYHDRSMQFAKHMQDLREDIMESMSKYRNLEYFQDYREIDLKC